MIVNKFSFLKTQICKVVGRGLVFWITGLFLQNVILKRILATIQASRVTMNISLLSKLKYKTFENNVTAMT